MDKNQDPKDRVLISQSIEITNLKITIEQLKDDLNKEMEQCVALKGEIQQLSKGDGQDEN